MQDTPDCTNTGDRTQSQGRPAPILESQLQKTIDDLYEKFKDVDDGELATYIPELGKANPDDFGICLATTEGEFSRLEPGTRNSQSNRCANLLHFRWHWRSMALKRY